MLGKRTFYNHLLDDITFILEINQDKRFLPSHVVVLLFVYFTVASRCCDNSRCI